MKKIKSESGGEKQALEHDSSDSSFCKDVFLLSNGVIALLEMSRLHVTSQEMRDNNYYTVTLQIHIFYCVIISNRQGTWQTIRQSWRRSTKDVRRDKPTSASPV